MGLQKDNSVGTGPVQELANAQSVSFGETTNGTRRVLDVRVVQSEHCLVQWLPLQGFGLKPPGTVEPC